MEKPKTGQFSWNELHTNQGAEAAEFYGQLFGWHTAPFDAAPPKEAAKNEISRDYLLFKTETNDHGVGGMMASLDKGAPATWLPYVVVDSADETVNQAKKLGAKIIMDPADMPNIGRIAIIQDPQGASIGVQQLP